METTKCTALVCFSQYVEGYGIVHGDPESTLKAARDPNIPNHVVGAFADAGWIKAPKGWKADDAGADDQGGAPAE